MNFDLGALNVLEVDVDAGITGEFEGLVSQQLAEPDFTSVRPGWNSDLQWISPKTLAGFALFKSAFERLGVAAHVRDKLDLDKEPRMYVGFIVSRSRCASPHFHVDWVQTGNQAFTFLSPISTDSGGFGLLYEKVTGSFGEYDYRPGKGLIFGDSFRHSTKPGQSEDPVALLCFTFGTDKMKYWDRIQETAGHQSALLCQPDGKMIHRTPPPTQL